MSNQNQTTAAISSKLSNAAAKGQDPLVELAELLQASLDASAANFRATIEAQNARIDALQKVSNGADLITPETFQAIADAKTVSEYRKANYSAVEQRLAALKLEGAQRPVIHVERRIAIGALAAATVVGAGAAVGTRVLLDRRAAKKAAEASVSLETTEG